MLQQQNPPPRPSCNAAVQNTETHKAFNCDHEFLKTDYFLEIFICVYICSHSAQSRADDMWSTHRRSRKKFNCKSYYFVQYFVSEHNDPTSPF